VIARSISRISVSTAAIQTFHLAFTTASFGHPVSQDLRVSAAGLRTGAKYAHRERAPGIPARVRDA
jgi:hypothetical protein